MYHPLLILLLALPVFAGGPLEIRFDRVPSASNDENTGNQFGLAEKALASFWESQGQSLGNCRIGAMVLGNPLNERIQFNESSLWTGGANPFGCYDVNEFGSYQDFGDL